MRLEIACVGLVLAAPTAARAEAVAAAPPLSIVVEQPKVTGALRRQVVHDTLGKATPAFESCYRRRLRELPTLAGQLTLVFTLDDQGRVTAIVASGLDTALGACSAAVTENLVFPRPKTRAVTRVQAPLTFAGLVSPADSGGIVMRSDRMTPTAPAQAATRGEIDKAIIRRVIRAAQPQVRACYETRLQELPQLAGTVTASFTIGGDGKVIESRASGMDDVVAACVAKVMGTLTFPKPRGGGHVLVNYPFVFKTGGEAP